MERTSADELVRYQERRLRMLVRLAACRSPFYREWFAETGVDPSSIRTLADLPNLPLLDRTHLIEEPERFLVYPRKLVWKAHSSGSSGRRVTAFRTPGSSAFELTALQRQWSWFGLPSRPRSLLLRSNDPDPNGTGRLTRLVPGAVQLEVSSFRLGAAQLTSLLADILAFGPEVVEGWPSSITLLASLLRDAGERLPVSAVITSSEVMTAEQLRLMQDVFCCPVVDHYGQTERVCLGGNCEAGGYHQFSDYGITELLPVPGRPDRWEIVGTPLHNWGFPLFRYRTGDEVGPAPVGPCPCGRAFPLLGRIDGRIEDTFTAANGQSLPMPSVVLDHLAGLRESQIAQLAPGRFEIRVVPSANADLPAVEAAARESVEKYYGSGQTLTIRVMERVPRTAGGKLKAAVIAPDDTFPEDTP